MENKITVFNESNSGNGESEGGIIITPSSGDKTQNVGSSCSSSISSSIADDFHSDSNYSAMASSSESDDEDSDNCIREHGSSRVSQAELSKIQDFPGKTTRNEKENRNSGRKI